MSDILEVNQVSVAYGRNTVVREISVGLKPGEIGCLLGPSGCGKTTLLRAIAGFEPVSGGEIVLDGQTVSRPGLNISPERRRVGMVFQDFALFPHLSVADNIAFGLKGLDKNERLERTRELLEVVGLPHYGQLYPHQLSGGQQQRIALARAMAPRPKLLLMDEPFSSMDVDLRESLAREVRRILRQEGVTALIVTHDQFEAFAIADRIAVMNVGHLQQFDTGYDLYHKPANHFVADFIGQGVLLPGTVLNADEVETELAAIPGKVPEGCQPGCPVEVLVRPDDILHDDKSQLRATIIDKAFRGAQFLYTLQLPSGARVLCLAPSHHDYEIGSQFGIRLEIDHLVMFRQRTPVSV